MASKLFKNDKNYILRKAQSKSKSKLLKFLIKKSIINYENSSNSLGLIDNTSKIIRNFKVKSHKELDFFYRKISAIYRYNYGEVQLSFLWDGSSHEEFYKRRWIFFFKKEINRMIRNNSFLKSVLHVSVFKNKNVINHHYNISSFIRKKYKIQVFKRKGVVLHSK